MSMQLIGLLVLVLVAFVIIAVVSVLMKPAANKKSSSKSLYRLKDPLFSPAERSFLGVLMQAVSDEMIVMGKIRVADIITTVKGLDNSERQTALNKITAKHFDYVICDRSTLEVISVVELNDKSHKRKKRAERDAFLREACASAGLRLLEFEAKASYSVTEVRNRLAGGVGKP